MRRKLGGANAIEGMVCDCRKMGFEVALGNSARNITRKKLREKKNHLRNRDGSVRN